MHEESTGAERAGADGTGAGGMGTGGTGTGGAAADAAAADAARAAGAGADAALAELRDHLADALAGKRLTKTQLATRTGLSRTTVQLAFQGGATPPSATTVATLARALGLAQDELLELRRRAAAAPASDTQPATQVAPQPAPQTAPQGEAATGAEPVPGQPITDWNPHDLEVHPAGLAPAGHGADAVTPPLPGYVRRRHDDVLAQAVRSAAQGHSRMVVLVGTSSTGKTRACWEAVQPLANEGWRLWHPFDPTRADAALEDLQRVRPRTVVWLNEAQHYFGDSLAGERIAAAVHALLAHPGRAPVLVLGTMWPEYERQYTALPTPGRPDQHSRVRELLAGRTLTVPDSFDAQALRAAAVLAKDGDQLLADTLTRAGVHGQVTQDLAGAPELLRRYEHGTPAARAVTEAAMDARRLGAGLHLPRAFLIDAATDYLSDGDYGDLDDDWAEAAFAELARPVHGKKAPLHRAAARPRRQPPSSPSPSPSPPPSPTPVSVSVSAGTVFRLADYLEQHGHTARRALCPPASFWHAAHTHLTHADDLNNLADAAFIRHRLQWEHHLRSKSAGAGHTSALLRLAELREDTGDRDGAEALYRQLAADGHAYALLRLAGLRGSAGDLDGAETLYRQLADAGDPFALPRMARLREEAGDLDGVEALYQELADTGDTHALVRVAGLREEAGDLEGAETLYRRAAEAGHGNALFRLAGLREEAGDLEGAEALYERLADAGDTYAFFRRAWLRERAGDPDGAEALYLQAAEAGHTSALVRLAGLRASAGDLEGAETLYRQLVDAGDTYALFRLARLREEAGDSDGAETLYEQAADAINPGTLVRLARLREDAGDLDGAEALYRRLADSGQTVALLHPSMRVLGGTELKDRWPHGLDPDGTPSQPWR
ncbi:tetratricopeptide repeat protein [Streptomyces sp. NBC_01310]|uniref:tetratricopeptide repeat protein n=1 Tax=Streptomyces sp. NBC_01310 TaxID=2903820 RepID=UPI0035B6418E|nr:tetratricopeptide repeat protein [Streptomyces sp. NBC_01310]